MKTIIPNVGGVTVESVIFKINDDRLKHNKAAEHKCDDYYTKRQRQYCAVDNNNHSSTVRFHENQTHLTRM